MPKSAWTEKDLIDDFLKERRLMRSLEKFVGGKLYEGDLRLRQKNHMILSYDVLINQVFTMKMEILLEPTSNKLMVVQIILWYLDSGCSKHITIDRSQLTNFISKFLGTVKFRNDQVAKIMGYGDYQIGNVTI
ncbi:hypothetical protein Tco_0595408 [Tanacetum coccineum]